MLSDLAFAYSEFSKFVQCPQPPYMLSTQDVLRYLRDTYELGIRYHHNALNPDNLWGWVDTDWTGDIETRRSHIVYVLMFNGVPISWKSLREDSVVLSTSEDEYMAVRLLLTPCVENILVTSIFVATIFTSGT
jgi:hypothetical protein